MKGLRAVGTPQRSYRLHGTSLDRPAGQHYSATATVEPVGFNTDADGRVAVEVQQLVRTIDGEVLADQVVTHVYAFREGLVERMDED